jgi:hypothetical protein
MGCRMLFGIVSDLMITINAMVVRTGIVEFKIVLLEVGMAEIALMSVQPCSLHSTVSQAHTSASTSTTTSYPCLFAML